MDADGRRKGKLSIPVLTTFKSRRGGPGTPLCLRASVAPRISPKWSPDRPRVGRRRPMVDSCPVPGVKIRSGSLHDGADPAPTALVMAGAERTRCRTRLTHNEFLP